MCSRISTVPSTFFDFCPVASVLAEFPLQLLLIALDLSFLFSSRHQGTFIFAFILINVFKFLVVFVAHYCMCPALQASCSNSVLCIVQKSIHLIIHLN